MLTVLVGCVGTVSAVDDYNDPDAHEIVTCDPGWFNVTLSGMSTPIAKCEAACQAPPTDAIGWSTTCKIGSIPNSPGALYCPSADVVAGGCCAFSHVVTDVHPYVSGGAVGLFPCL